MNSQDREVKPSVPGVSYAGYWGAYSGMGEACRNYILALYKAGVPLTTHHVQNIESAVSLGEGYDVAKALWGKRIDYKIKILHITPDLITKFLEPMKYHIFHLFWEVDSLPKWWVWSLNLCNEVWTGSEWNKQVFIKSGVKCPIYVFPQAVSSPVPEQKPFIVPYHRGFLFYSIFQWIERKNPKALLSAYWKEFQGEDFVGLLIKSYRDLGTRQEADAIASQIRNWKTELNLPSYAPVYLCHQILSQEEILRLHQTGDCFISAHRGEGWGIPIARALTMGKPVISTNLGGVHEYLPADCAYLAPYTMKPVFNMDFVPWYDKSQRWAEVDEDALRKSMRDVFQNREQARLTGQRGQLFAEKTFSYEVVGNALKKRIEEIGKIL